MSGQIRVTALAVFRRREEILVFHGWDATRGFTFARPPGGGVDFGERAEDAVRREMREELGIEVGSVEQLGVIENIFAHGGSPGHQVAFVFAVEAPDRMFYERDEHWGEEETPGPDGETRFELTWRQIDDESVKLVPEGIRDLLREAWARTP